jgi:hypothetical protein
MTTLITSFGIIRKLDNNTFILPANLTGKKLIALKKKNKNFFSDFQVITITKEQKERAKRKSKKIDFFRPLFSFVPLTGITSGISNENMLFLLGLLISFVAVSFCVSLFHYYHKRKNETTKVSFNSHLTNF